MSVKILLKYMDFMKNAKKDTISVCGKNLWQHLICFLYQLW